MPPEFGLQSVLDHRHSRVEALEIELGRRLFEQQQALRALEALQAERRQLFATLREKQDGHLDLPALALMRYNVKRVEQRIVRQEERLAELAAQVEATRAQLVAAKQDEEALVILKNKELERYHAQELRVENNQRDDIYIMRAHRRAQDGTH